MNNTTTIALTAIVVILISATLVVGATSKVINSSICLQERQWKRKWKWQHGYRRGMQE
jgi:hypothetical protein